MATKVKQVPLWKNLPFKGYFYASLALNIFTALFIVGARNFLPPVAPLLYGRPEGAAQLAPTLWLTLAPLTSLALTILNMFLVKPVKDKFMQQVLIISTFLISLLTTITIFKIIFLVGFF